ncbi:MAG: hypothetical protein OXG36_15100 [Caldilineaceae bacterium]|nr:hypothetical protein [Caldilineaceae bacterium]
MSNKIVDLLGPAVAGMQLIGVVPVLDQGKHQQKVEAAERESLVRGTMPASSARLDR